LDEHYRNLVQLSSFSKVSYGGQIQVSVTQVNDEHFFLRLENITHHLEMSNGSLFAAITECDQFVIETKDDKASISLSFVVEQSNVSKF
jgi:hypothetical protein